MTETLPSSNALCASPIRIGDLVAGKYRVEGALGQGAMGVVVAATHVDLQQRVAIKFMFGETSRDPALVERFQREARVLARIKSEHVTRVIDVDRFRDGTPYIIMEFLHGCDLATEIEQRGALPLKETADYLLQASEVLAEAHALGIVHRDLKPSNLFLNQRADGTRQLKVMDFGISKMGDGRSDGSLTNTQAMLGSPLYMAPEQIRDTKNVDARSDIWSLGITLYEMLSGRPPFQAEQVGGLLAAIMTEGYPSIRSQNPNIPREVEDLIERCLQKDRNKRIASVGELARSLKPFASSAGKVVADRVSRTSLHPVGQSTAVPPSSDPLPFPRQTGFGAAVTKSSVARSTLPWLGGVVAVACIGTATFWYLRDAAHSPIDPQPTPAQSSIVTRIEPPKAPEPLPTPAPKPPSVTPVEDPASQAPAPVEQLPAQPIANPEPPKAVAPIAPRSTKSQPKSWYYDEKLEKIVRGTPSKKSVAKPTITPANPYNTSSVKNSEPAPSPPPDDDPLSERK